MNVGDFQPTRNPDMLSDPLSARIVVKASALGWDFTARKGEVIWTSPSGEVVIIRGLCLWLEFPDQHAAEAALAAQQKGR